MHTKPLLFTKRGGMMCWQLQLQNTKVNFSRVLVGQVLLQFTHFNTFLHFVGIFPLRTYNLFDLLSHSFLHNTNPLLLKG